MADLRYSSTGDSGIKIFLLGMMGTGKSFGAKAGIKD